jgi:peptidoglycan biosynthesis protein MviN/MurJ (putative lipid II flippase)
MTGGVYLTAFVVNLLADNFGAKKDFDRAFATVAYSYTPMFVAGVFLIYPSGLSWVASLAGLYGLYLLYTGLQPMMKSPDDKKTGYLVATLIVAAAVAVVLAVVLSSVLSKS